jgi:hypothetical protein
VTEPELPAAPADTANPPAARKGLNRVETLAIALAILGGGGVIVALVSAREEPAASVAAASAETREAPGAPRPARPLVPASGATWTSNTMRWTANARRSAAFELAADNSVGIWMRQVRPLLIVRCLKGATDVFVFTHSAAAIEPRTEDHTVRLRFDDDPETRELWPDSSEHDALFAPDGAAFARRLATASTLEVGFTPHNAPPTTAHFRVSGLGPLLASAAGCTAAPKR